MFQEELRFCRSGLGKHHMPSRVPSAVPSRVPSPMPCRSTIGQVQQNSVIAV